MRNRKSGFLAMVLFMAAGCVTPVRVPLGANDYVFEEGAPKAQVFDLLLGIIQSFNMQVDV